MTRHVIANKSEIPAGTRQLFQINGRSIAVFRIGDEYFAVLNRCPHQGASLFHGVLTGFPKSDSPGQCTYLRGGEILRCPWHAWEFDIRTGQSWFDPSNMKLRRYAVGVVAGEELVEGPYKAETFPVSVEDEYVVVDM
jgi:nitrite reductase/ring-hydroxylating ferredoxin subunit